MGFANTLQINRQFDAQFAGTGGISQTALNPNLTYAYPIFNPFHGVGPTFYQAFVPNSRGITADVTAPVRLGSSTLNTRVEYQHLERRRAKRDLQCARRSQLSDVDAHDRRRVLTGEHAGGPRVRTEDRPKRERRV